MKELKELKEMIKTAKELEEIKKNKISKAVEGINNLLKNFKKENDWIPQLFLKLTENMNNQEREYFGFYTTHATSLKHIPRLQLSMEYETKKYNWYLDGWYLECKKNQKEGGLNYTFFENYTAEELKKDLYNGATQIFLKVKYTIMDRIKYKKKYLKEKEDFLSSFANFAIPKKHVLICQNLTKEDKTITEVFTSEDTNQLRMLMSKLAQDFLNKLNYKENKCFITETTMTIGEIYKWEIVPVEELKKEEDKNE